MNVETLVRIVNIFDAIKDVSSRTMKEDLLKVNKDFDEFRTMLEFLYNPYKLTGIKTKKLVKFATFTSANVKQFDDVLDALSYIEEHNTGRDEDVKAIANFINKHDKETYGVRTHEFLQEFFTKSAKIGLTSSTINKVYGKDTIPEFKVMLAKKFEDEESKVTGDFYVTLKMDGIRCICKKENGSVKFFTRTGQPILGMKQLEESYKNLPDNMIYDGELLLDDDTIILSDDLFRATQKVVRKDGLKENLFHILFDMLPLDEFSNGKSSKTFTNRRLDLSVTESKLPENSYVKVLPVLYQGESKEAIFELLDKVVDDGKEGLMVNLSNGYYVNKRTHSLLKVKKMHTLDLEVVGYEEGNGKNKGTLGALIVSYKGCKVKVGSGYEDSERNLIWSMKDDMIGKIIEVQYFEESRNEDGGLSLRFPVFKSIRDDKTEADF